MKIVQINSVCSVGSTGRIAVDISKNLNENQIENYIIYGEGNSAYPNAIKIGNVFNIRWHQIQTRFFGWHGFASKKATKQLINILENINPDIIHLHNIHGFYLNIEILFNYLEKSNKKVVWTLHDCWPFTGHCAYFDFVGCKKWENECFNCENRLRYPKSYFFDRSKKAFQKKKLLFTKCKNLTIVTPSTWLKNLVEKSFLSKYNSLVINNGIDLDIFKKVDYKDVQAKYAIENKFVILGVANGFDERKGLKYFIELSKKLTDNFKIVLIGVSLEQIKDLPSNIIGIERTESVTELAKFYSLADVLFNPTLEDNFPTVNLEALSCGTPVITFDTGGSKEAIDENTGFIVKKGDIVSTINAINEINKNGKDYYSVVCSNRAKQVFDKNEKYEQYLTLYKKITEG